MGFKPDVPTQGEETVKQPKDLDEYEIVRVEFVLDSRASDTPQARVTWCEGYKKSGDFVPVVAHETTIPRAVLQPLLDAKGSSKAMDKLLRGLIWDALLGVNAVGAGTKE